MGSSSRNESPRTRAAVAVQVPGPDAMSVRPSLVIAGLVVALAAGLLPACTGFQGLGESGGTGSGAPGPVINKEYNGEDGGPPAGPVPDGTTVAELETLVTPFDELLLRGTLPIAPTTFPRPDGLMPFTVLDHDGMPVTTQTEIVTRYPLESDGADVVEVLARVHSDPSAPPGTYVRYSVVQTPQSPSPAPGQPGPEDLITGPASLPTAVLNLLADPRAVEIAAYDCFGNRYAAYPLDGTGFMELERYGPAQTELRVYENLVPEPFVAGSSGTLPHSLGVHAYVSTYADEEFIGLDLRFHNGHSGNDPSTDQDDPLDAHYFDRIEVTVPTGWVAQQHVEDPSFGDFVDTGSKRVYELVGPLNGGAQHVMRWQAQFHRRLMLSTSSQASRARSFLDGRGRAFCVRGFDPVGGREYWSWWNRGTARYFPQNYVLPRLDHLGRGSLLQGQSAAFDRIEGHLTLGTSEGKYPFLSTKLGWGHPWGVKYGGMTGGLEIHLWEGVEPVHTGSHESIRYFQALHRMHTDRMPSAFYDHDGEPTSVEDWVVRVNGTDDYVPFAHFLRPSVGPGDPFGLSQAPQFQIQYVRSNGRTPFYESAHYEFDPTDYQHFTRYTRSAKTLVWLTNDSLAKDDLRMQAENFHLSFHEYRNAPNGGYYQVTGLRNAQEYVKKYPAKGLAFGRGEGWGTDCAVAAYACADPTWRARKLPWFQDIARVLSDGQVSCTGFIQAYVHPKFLGGYYRARQSIEAGITENMLQGLRETVFRNADPAFSSMVKDVLRDSTYSSVSDMAWFPGQKGPWTHTGVGPLDPSYPVFCSRGSMPGGSWSTGLDTYLNWSSFAYAYEMTGDSLFLDKALEQVGGTDLLKELERDGLENLPNRSAVLALMQHLNGKL